jgi:hypothetical protein
MMTLRAPSKDNGRDVLAERLTERRTSGKDRNTE